MIDVGIGEWESERLGVDCPSYGVAEEGDSGRCSGRELFNVFDEWTFTFDCCTWYGWSNNVVALFPDLVVCKPLIFSERLSSLGVHVRS